MHLIDLYGLHLPGRSVDSSSVKPSSMLPGGSRMICVIQDMVQGLNMFYTDPAQHLTRAGQGMTCRTCGIPSIGPRRWITYRKYIVKH